MNFIQLHNIQIYHIIHIDKLQHIVNAQALLCDKTISATHSSLGTMIGMDKLKKRRMDEITLSSHPQLYVGECVPFYFCPRSVMLYVIHKANNNSDIKYKDGQDNIIHLVSNIKSGIDFANNNKLKWAFTNSNASSYYFKDFSNINDIQLLNWQAIQENSWSKCREEKQAEFLIEQRFPFELIHTIGVKSLAVQTAVQGILAGTIYKPNVNVLPSWYY